MELSPVTRVSTADEVYDQLAGSIIAGGVDPGDAMPSERSLADALQVSRPVVREALKRLAHAGLVRIRHGGSTLVTDYRRTAGPDLLGQLLLDRNGDLDLEVARSIVEARSDLGPAVAAAAARRASPADVGALREVVAAMSDTDDVLELQRLSLDFWDRVVDASGNLVHRLLFNALRRAYEPVMEALAVVMQAEVSHVDGYARVLDAIARADPDGAAGTVRDLVDRGARATLAVLDDLLAAPVPALPEGTETSHPGSAR